MYGDLGTFLSVLGGLGTTPGRASSNLSESEYRGTSALNRKIFLLGVENGEDDEDGEEDDEELRPSRGEEWSGVAGGATP